MYQEKSPMAQKISGEKPEIHTNIQRKFVYNDPFPLSKSKSNVIFVIFDLENPYIDVSHAQIRIISGGDKCDRNNVSNCLSIRPKIKF